MSRPAILHSAVRNGCEVYASCPRVTMVRCWNWCWRGEIGKRGGSANRWANALVSSNLTVSTAAPLTRRRIPDSVMITVCGAAQPFRCAREPESHWVVRLSAVWAPRHPNYSHGTQGIHGRRYSPIFRTFLCVCRCGVRPIPRGGVENIKKEWWGWGPCIPCIPWPFKSTAETHIGDIQCPEHSIDG